MEIEVKSLDESAFLYPNAWQSLLSQSDADPLFLSWPWQVAWWRTWGESLGLRARILVMEVEGRWLGLVPLYCEEVNSNGVWRMQRLQFIGNAWHRTNTVRTEYLGLVLHKEACYNHLVLLMNSLVGYKDWHEWACCDVDSDSINYERLFEFSKKYHWRILTRQTDEGRVIDTTGIFGDYLLTLGRNTRLKLYNRRDYAFQRYNRICIRKEENSELFFKILNDFHVTRWGKPCFDGKSLEFHLRLLSLISELGDPLFFPVLSILEIDGQAVSALYDIVVGEHRYNIQAGFNENFDRKLSLGTLHLGYAIEEAFTERNTLRYDLLAGSGKRTFYKARLGGLPVHFKTIQLIRSPWLKAFYSLAFSVPPKIRHSLSRVMRKPERSSSD